MSMVMLSHEGFQFSKKKVLLHGGAGTNSINSAQSGPLCYYSATHKDLEPWYKVNGFGQYVHDYEESQSSWDMDHGNAKCIRAKKGISVYLSFAQ